MKRADLVLEDEQLVSTVYEAPRSRPRGMLQPAHLSQPQAIESKGNRNPTTSGVTGRRSRANQLTYGRCEENRNEGIVRARARRDVRAPLGRTAKKWPRTNETVTGQALPDLNQCSASTLREPSG
jgi:hypothetical protein